MNEKDILSKGKAIAIREVNKDKINYRISELLADLSELAPPLRKKPIRDLNPFQKKRDFGI